MAVDQIRIEVASQRAPAHMTRTRVEVRSGGFSRVAHVMGKSGLKFSPPLEGDSFEVALDPVFTATYSACITRIELVSDGKPVVSIQP